MRERLGDRKAARGRLRVGAEEVERELVAGAWRVGEGGFGEREPLAMVLDQLPRAPDRILDRIAVSRQRDRRRELDRPLQRLDVVAERIEPALRPEADGRRDPSEQMVG